MTRNFSSIVLQGFYNSSLRRYRDGLAESSRKFKLRRNADDADPLKKVKAEFQKAYLEPVIIHHQY